MILSAVNICYDPLHQPFAAEGAVKIQNLNSERPALKIIRAVLRDSDIDPEDAVNYSIHRCYCKFKIKVEDDDKDDTFHPDSTLDELEIKDGDSVFIRKIDDRVDEEKEDMEEGQGSTPRRSSRKRKETGYNEDDYNDEPFEPVVTATSAFVKRRPTSRPSSGPATVDEVSFKLDNLSSKAAKAARSISKLLGGDGWKCQSIGKLGSIQTKSEDGFYALLRLVKKSLTIPLLSKSEGLFNSDLVEALVRAYHQRVRSLRPKNGQRNFFDLGLSDYEQANELLKGKIEGNGSWEKSSLNHLDESSLLKPAVRFPLSDSGLSGYYLSTARIVSGLWNNDQWLNQAPLPVLSPISLKDPNIIALLRQIAGLTRVKPGEATPDGFPLIVLQTHRESIRKNKKAFNTNHGGHQKGWSQKRNLKDTLALLKERVGSLVDSPSSSTATGSSKAARGDEVESEDPRAKRRKIAS